MANKYWVNGSGAWSQPVFVKDTFTDTAGTDIASHTPDVGGAWTYRSGSTGDLVIDNNNRLRTASAADCRIIDATVPSSPDYVVQADITQVTNSTSTEFNIMGRYDLATDNWYAIHFYNGNNNIFLYKFISGSFTLLGTYGYTPTVGVPFNVQLVMSGTTIQAVLNGTLVLSVTDSSVTGAGHGGVRSFNSADNDSIGTRVDNFQVINSNWATSSGGIGSPANIPTSSDNVIFDINSGNIFTATMDYTTTIASISVAGNSNFGYHEDTGKFVTLRWNSNNNVVTVAGNVTFNGDVQFAGNSGVGGFVISASSTLTSYSKSFIPYIGINGSGINVTVAAGVSGGAGVFYNTNLTANYIDLLHGTLTLPEFDFGGNPQQNPVIKVDTFSASNSTLTRVLDFGGVGSLAGAYILVSTSFDCSVSTGLTFANTIGSQIYFNTQYVYAADSFIDETSDNLLTHTTDTGQHWIQPYEPPSGYDGTFSISSQNRAYYSNAGTLNRALYLIDSLIPVDDYFVQADMYVESVQGEAGIVGRAWNFQDTFYLFGYVGISPNANWELILVNDGSYTTLATSNATLTPGSTYTMKMTMIGNAITCYVNGSPIMAVTDSAIGNGTLFGAGGSAGLRGDGDASLESSGFHFDNFIVQSMVTYNSTATFKGGGMSYYSVNLENGKLNITGNNTIGTYTAVSGTQTLLNGNNTINQFVANPSTSFVLQAGFTQTLTLSSTMNGSYLANVSFQSSIPGLQANISFSGASKIVAWWSLKDIKISSGNLIVYRGTDLGDNTNVAFMTGFLKYYTYDVYGYLGDYRGQYNDVVTDPQWSQEINNPGGQIDIRRGVDPTNYGEGTLVDYNNKIVIKAFTEDNINGVVIFQGFTADYTPNIQPSSQYVDIIALSYGAELSQYPLITDPQIDVNIPFNYDPGTINNFTSNKLAIAFTTGSGVTNISSFNTYSMLYRNTKTVTLSLYKDDGSSTPDNTVPIWQETFTYPFGNTSYFTSAYGDFVPAIPSITVLANTKYWLVLDTGISGQADFNNVRTVNPYGNAYAAYWNGSAWVQNSSWGLVFFATYTSSGNTTVTYTGTNIKTALTDILNNYNLQGGHVLWDNTTIDDPGTTFTNTFNSNTVLDGVQKILAQAPAGWYWYVDQATNMLHFHNTANEPKHYFTIGRDLTSVQLQKTMETVVNNVIVSGGPDGSGYNLFREYVNVASQQRYGKRVQFYNDNQITTTAAADAVGTKIITQFKNPTYRAPITVLSYPDKGYNLESIKPGDVFFIMGLSGAVNLQASRVDYKAVTVALDSSTIPPQINNQVADTQNAVQQQQTANNPSFPTIVPII